MCGGGGDPEPQRESKGERRQAQTMAEKWNYYVTELAPYQAKFVNDVQMSEADFDSAARRATVDTEAAYAKSNQLPSGVHTKGNVATALAKNELSKSVGKSANKVRSGLQTSDRHTAGIQSIIAAGNGERADQQQNESFYSNLNFNNARHDANMSWNNFQHSEQMKGEMLGAAAAAGYYGYSNLPTGGSAYEFTNSKGHSVAIPPTPN